jgi:hypothetical protein
MAQVGELKRIIDRAKRPVALIDREPDSQIIGGTCVDRGGCDGGVGAGDPDGSRSGDGHCRRGGNE